jgi:hypothetical protein
MQYIVLVAVIGILLLQLSGAIPLDSVGGPMVIALAFFLGALAVAVHEAWTKKRASDQAIGSGRSAPQIDFANRSSAGESRAGAELRRNREARIALPASEVCCERLRPAMKKLG